MMELASNHGKRATTIEVIARNQGISGKYIHFLMTGLKSAGLVRTIRGPNGGFQLAKDPSKISALDVVSVLEGWKAPVECVENAKACPRSSRCAARELWQDVASAIDGALSSRTLADLSSKQRALLTESADYNI
jgi:Rrf2 family protein